MAAAAGGDDYEVTSRRASACDMIRRLAEQHPVVVFATSSCYMSLVAKELLTRLGVNPTIVDIDLDHVADSGEAEVERALVKLSGSKQPIPLVFVGGKLIGGLDCLVKAHVDGTLSCRLREAKVLTNESQEKTSKQNVWLENKNMN